MQQWGTIQQTWLHCTRNVHVLSSHPICDFYNISGGHELSFSPHSDTYCLCVCVPSLSAGGCRRCCCIRSSPGRTERRSPRCWPPRTPGGPATCPPRGAAPEVGAGLSTEKNKQEEGLSLEYEEENCCCIEAYLSVGSQLHNTA